MNWKRILSFGKNEILGLDIGTSAVKMVALRKNGDGYSTTAASISEIAASEDGEVTKRTNIIKAIRKCFELANVKTRWAVCGVSGPEVAVRDFMFPSLSTDEIAAAVLLEASQVCPFNAADSAIDYQLIPNGYDKTKGVLVAATNTVITGKVELAKEARLRCILMDVEGLALLNCFNSLDSEHQESEPGQTIAILNVGGSQTTLAIMDDNGWPFVRDMTYAGDDIIAGIAGDNNMSTEIVRGILSGESTTTEPELHGSLEKASQKLIANVSETLRYYSAQGKSSNVKKLFVCGGFALAEGFIELLNSRLGAEAVLWNPFEKIQCNGDPYYKDVLTKTGPVMAVAAGLAMRSV